MFKKLTMKDRRSKIEKEIDDVLELMKTYSPASKEYTQMAENVERLHKARAQARTAHVTPDGALVVAANLLGLYMIMNFEKTEILRTKALGFVLRGRL